MLAQSTRIVRRALWLQRRPHGKLLTHDVADCCGLRSVATTSITQDTATRRREPPGHETIPLQPEGDDDSNEVDAARKVHETVLSQRPEAIGNPCDHVEHVKLLPCNGLPMALCTHMPTAYTFHPFPRCESSIPSLVMEIVTTISKRLVVVCLSAPLPA